MTKLKQELTPTYLMIDIETLATNTQAKVLQVACIVADQEFNHRQLFTFWLETNCQGNRKSNQGTVLFHRNNGFTEKWQAASRLHPRVVINKINDLLSSLPSDILIYSYGLNFDIPILDSLGISVSTPLVIPQYRNLRCLRTEEATARRLGFNWQKPKATKHEALQDCVDQLELLKQLTKFYRGIQLHVHDPDNSKTNN